MGLVVCLSFWPFLVARVRLTTDWSAKLGEDKPNEVPDRTVKMGLGWMEIGEKLPEVYWYTYVPGIRTVSYTHLTLPTTPYV